MGHPLAEAQWLNPVPRARLTDTGVEIVTQPHTDLWQRTYYGFRVANAPAALVDVASNVTFTVRARFDYRDRFDQAGILVWIDEDNWFKAAIEHEDDLHGRLGSVLTRHGYSDWATRDVPATTQIWLRLSRRGPDFLLEARTADTWEQLRVFHLGGPTEQASVAADQIPAEAIEIGVYACSPQDSSFTAQFDEITLEPSIWEPHV